MNQFGYLGVFLLILIENIFPPIPSEVILTLGGFMTTTTMMTKFGIIVASTAGSVVGAAILYWIGTLLDVERLEKIVQKYGKFLRLTIKDIHKADAWFDKYGVWAVFFGRLSSTCKKFNIDSSWDVEYEVWIILIVYNIRNTHLEYGFSFGWSSSRRELGSNCRIYGYLLQYRVCYL